MEYWYYISFGPNIVFVANPMQVTLQPLYQGGSPVVVDTNTQTTVASLISSYCAQRGIAFDSALVVFDGKKRPLPQFSILSSLGVSNGQSLHIGYKEKRFSFFDQWPLFIAVLALVIGVVGILTISMTYGLTGGKYPDDFGVVMDAGSSKTNTIVYKWKSNKHNGTGCVSQVTNCLAVGGIAEKDPMELDQVINCAKTATSVIDEAAKNHTPLYFAATAGMRLLNSTDPARAQSILDQLHLHLNETGLSVRAIEIISGTDEGVYGWVTSNFLQQTLEIPQKSEPWVPTTYGALDMGGASMQIAYALPDTDNRTATGTRKLSLYGQTHNVFAHSNLCFGRAEAERRYRYLLLKDPKTAITEDPCSPEDYLYNVTGTDLFARPCTKSTKFPEIVTNPDDFLEYYTFTGTSNPEQCQKNVSQLLDGELCKKYNFIECFKKLDNIPDNQEYLAFATYFFTTDFLNVTKGTLEEYKKASQIFCEKNYTEVEKVVQKPSDLEYATQYCFNSKYIYEVLINGFHFSESTWKNINFVKKIAGKDVGWTLGYMINATNIIPEKAKSPKALSEAALTVSLIIFILIVMGTGAFLLQQHRKRDNDNSYGNA